MLPISNAKLFLVAAVALSSCKSAKDEDSAIAAGDVSYTLNIQSGTFEYEPWIVISPNASKNKVYSYSSKLTSETTAVTTGDCKASPLPTDAYQLNSFCRGIAESGAFTFSITDPTSGTKAEGSATFELALKQEDLAVTATIGSDSGISDTEYTAQETLTFCHYSGDDIDLAIQFRADDKIGAGKVGYLMGTLTDPEVGKSIIIDQNNLTLEGQVFVVDQGVELPKKTDDEYFTTRQAEGLITRKRPVSACIYQVTELNRNAVTKGTFTCTNMAYYSDTPPANSNQLGDVLSLSGNWQCDRYH